MVPAEVMTDVALVISELVTNSLQHSGRTDQQVDVAIRAGPDALRLEVRDAGPGFEPTPPSAGPPPGVSGWGLFIVDRLASRWGTRPGGMVWAELDY